MTNSNAKSMKEALKLLEEILKTEYGNNVSRELQIHYIHTAMGGPHETTNAFLDLFLNFGKMMAVALRMGSSKAIETLTDVEYEQIAAEGLLDYRNGLVDVIKMEEGK